MSWLLIALGAATGSACRYLLDRAVRRGRFPTGILTVNLLGCLLAGTVAGVQPGPRAAALLSVGLLGGFTTASTLAADVVQLERDGDRRSAVLDLLLNVGPGLVLAALGVVVGRALR